MGVFDQAARFAAQADPEVVPRRLLASSGLMLSFREWLDTRTLPLPGGTDRTADLVAGLIDPNASQKVIDETVRRTRFDIFDRLTNLYTDVANHSTVTPGIRERAWLTATGEPGELGREAAKDEDSFLGNSVDDVTNFRIV